VKFGCIGGAKCRAKAHGGGIGGGGRPSRRADGCGQLRKGVESGLPLCTAYMDGISLMGIWEISWRGECPGAEGKWEQRREAAGQRRNRSPTELNAETRRNAEKRREELPCANLCVEASQLANKRGDCSAEGQRRNRSDR
jgi:hypothetical protein